MEINKIYRVTKDGGVVVWIVGDATIKGSETGTSFKQALFFNEYRDFMMKKAEVSIFILYVLAITLYGLAILNIATSRDRILKYITQTCQCKKEVKDERD